MARLSGEQFGQMQKAFVNTFSESELAQLLRIRLDRDLHEVAGSGPKAKVVYELIDKADRDGWVEDLIRAALAESPRSPDLRAFAGQVGMAGLLAPPDALGPPVPGLRAVLIDAAHGQAEWESPLFRGDPANLLQVLQMEADSPGWEVRRLLQSGQIHADALKAWGGLILAIPHHVRIEETTRYELVKWVRQGGRLVLLGFELGERHHETNLNELAGAFGLRFNADIVAPRGWKGSGKPYGAAVDFATTGSDHPLLAGVGQLRLWNLCTLTVEPGADVLLTLGEHSFCWLTKESANYSSHGWLRGGYQEFDVIRGARWVPVLAVAPTGLTGQGSVLAVGTWELLGRRGALPPGFDNRRFVQNLLRWCAGQEP